jgi:hypothetical protein
MRRRSLAQETTGNRSRRKTHDDSERAPVHSRHLCEPSLSSKTNLRDDGDRDSVAPRTGFAVEALRPMVPGTGGNRVGSE